jgi:hypothetical protein
MRNPILKVKKNFINILNGYLDEAFFSPDDFTYNHKRKVFQSTKLFKFKNNKLQSIDCDLILSTESFKFSKINNYINVYANANVQIEYLKHMTSYLISTMNETSYTDYKVYYNSYSDLNNLSYSSFSQSQINLLNFYGYKVNTLFEKNIARENLKVVFNLDNKNYSYQINLFDNDSILTSTFSNNFLNLILLSKGVNSKFNYSKSITHLNTKNKYYITAYVIARLHKLTEYNSLVKESLSDTNISNYSFYLGELLYNRRKALSLAPLVNLLIEVCLHIFENEFFNNDLNKLSYYISIINFLTNISQTTFLNY